MSNGKLMLAIVVIFLGVASWAYIKSEAYDGDLSCLFVRCIKVK